MNKEQRKRFEEFASQFSPMMKKFLLTNEAFFECFQAGQQSCQVEIKELKAKIDLLETKNNELEDEIDRLRLGDEY